MQRFLVRRAEGDVVHGAGTLVGGRKVRLDGDVQFGGRAAFAHREDMDVARPVRVRIGRGLPHVHDLDQHGLGVADIRNAEGDGAEALDLVFGRNRAPFPRMGRRAGIVHGQAEALAFDVLEIERGAARDVADLAGLDLDVGKAVPPPFERGEAGDAKARAGNAVRAAPLVADRPVEEGEVRAGRGKAVGIEEVVGAGVVLVDGLLDEAQAERLRVEAQVLLRIGGDRRQVMDAGKLLGHGHSSPDGSGMPCACPAAGPCVEANIAPCPRRRKTGPAERIVHFS